MHLSRAKCELQQCVAQQPEAVRTHVADLLVAGALGQLTTRLTQLEASAAQAGENLVTYCSGTEWFLIDDVHMHLGEVVHVLDALDFLGLSTTDFNEEVQVLRKLLEVVKQLQHFNASFFGIILQEGIKLFQREDTTGKNKTDFMSVYPLSYVSLLFSHWIGVPAGRDHQRGRSQPRGVAPGAGGGNSICR